MPMSARLLRPRSTGFHPEAQDWRNRVIANGGTVSGSTLTAVSNFCRSIHAAGLRDRFLRLNLLCGTGLNAALVPLYRGQSSTGTQLGTATDANSNFVSGDYVETGSTGGLKGNGTSKSLDTGLTISNAPIPTISMSAYADSMETSGSNVVRELMGALIEFDSFRGAELATLNGFATPAWTRSFRCIGQSATAACTVTSDRPSACFVSGSHNSGTSYSLYENGVAIQTATATVTQPTTTATLGLSFIVFARRNSTIAVQDWTAARIKAYHIGTSMTDAQHLSFYNALQTFQTALGRQV